VTLVFMIAAIAVVAVVALLAVGRLGELPDVEGDRAPLALPADRPLDGQDVDGVRFAVGLRGYRMDEVDDVLDRLSDDLAARDARIAELESHLVRAVEPGPTSASSAAQPSMAVPAPLPAEPAAAQSAEVPAEHSQHSQPTQPSVMVDPAVGAPPTGDAGSAQA
jgi:DivIVA domain-containing protein